METDITFETYLAAKKIDPVKFKQEDSDKYQALELVFDQMHPDSFTAQKLFLINPIRKKFHLESEEVKEIIKEKPTLKVIIRPKIKI